MAQQRSVALITGASSGIGLELARVFAANGYSLAIAARDQGKLDAVAAELRSAYGVPVDVFVADLGQAGAADKLWATRAAANVAVDVLVNNAGSGMYGKFQEQALDALKQMQFVNMMALTTLTSLALPKMLARGQGRILNVASMVGFQPGAPLAAVYYATKSYVLSFSTGLARELRGTGVSVTALCPGPTRTAFEERAGLSAARIYKWALFPS